VLIIKEILLPLASCEGCCKSSYNHKLIVYNFFLYSFFIFVVYYLESALKYQHYLLEKHWNSKKIKKKKKEISFISYTCSIVFFLQFIFFPYKAAISFFFNDSVLFDLEKSLVNTIFINFSFFRASIVY
jgi:hypothetical protein